MGISTGLHSFGGISRLIKGHIFANRIQASLADKGELVARRFSPFRQHPHCEYRKHKRPFQERANVYLLMQVETHDPTRPKSRLIRPSSVAIASPAAPFQPGD